MEEYPLINRYIRLLIETLSSIPDELTLSKLGNFVLENFVCVFRFLCSDPPGTGRRETLSALLGDWINVETKSSLFALKLHSYFLQITR